MKSIIYRTNFYDFVYPTVLLLVFVTCMYLYIFTVVWRHYKKNCCTVPQQVYYSPKAPGISATWPQHGKAKVAEPLRNQFLPDEKLSARNSGPSPKGQLLRDSTLSCNSSSNEVSVEMGHINHDKTKSTCYELKKDSFRFVLIVDDGAGRNNLRNEQATGFRGIIYVGGNVGRSKSVERHNTQKMYHPLNAYMGSRFRERLQIWCHFIIEKMKQHHRRLQKFLNMTVG